MDKSYAKDNRLIAIERP